MDSTYWLKQSLGKPLFPELSWSRPENKNTAGKLLIIGGNAHGFAVPAAAYGQSVEAGIGTTKVLLPDSLRKTVGNFFEAGEFAPSTPSGSFSQRALAELLEYSGWADGVLLAGDLGRNSETAIVLEQFVSKTPKPLTITRDALDYFKNTSSLVFQRPNTTLVLSLAQLQKLCMAGHFTQAITFGMDMVHLVDALHALTVECPVQIIVKHLQALFVASGGQVSTTHLPEDPKIWRVKTAAYAAVWCLQNPTKPFEALCNATLEVSFA